MIGTTADPARRERFVREAQAAAALNHPNIVTIHSVEDADGIQFLTLEVVDGQTLSNLVPASGLLVPGVILQPSGVFAAVLAQESDCVYVKAS
jgi:serine/threonine protein kinase